MSLLATLTLGLSVGLSLGLLGACGQKGPLRLEGKPAAATPETPASAPR